MKILLNVTDEKADLIQWLDEEAANRERSRSWMILEAIRQWKDRLERERQSPS